MARAYDGVALDEAIREKAAIMGTSIGQNDGGTIGQDGDGNGLALVEGRNDRFSWAGPQGLSNGETRGLRAQSGRLAADVLT